MTEDFHGTRSGGREGFVEKQDRYFCHISPPDDASWRCGVITHVEWHICHVSGKSLWHLFLVDGGQIVFTLLSEEEAANE